MYCIVTCGARDNNWSRPNPTYINGDACGLQYTTPACMYSQEYTVMIKLTFALWCL